MVKIVFAALLLLALSSLSLTDGRNLKAKKPKKPKKTKKPKKPKKPKKTKKPKSPKGEMDHYIELSNETVHWGYFSKDLAPILTVDSGDVVTVEMATHHACDDWDKMIKGDPGMESVFTWSEEGKTEDFRGATGEGDGVHVLTGPIFVNSAMPGDLLKVQIQDLYPRVNPDGATYGSNAGKDVHVILFDHTFDP